jgi:hypothetical protein
MSGRGITNAVDPGYPYWTEPVNYTDNDGGDMTLYWAATTEINAIVRGVPGRYVVHCSEPLGTCWETCEVNVPTMEEAQRIAEVIVKFIALEKPHA